jgi:hypothetical protein
LHLRKPAAYTDFIGHPDRISPNFSIEFWRPF